MSLLKRACLSERFQVTFISPPAWGNQSGETLVVEIDHSRCDQILSQFANRLPSSMKRAVPKRQFEYLLGRWCAAVRLIELGCAEEQSWILSKGRRPVWPDGFVGSISHSRDAVAVVVQQQSPDCTSVGVDIESIAHFGESFGVLDLCFTHAEALLLDSLEFGLPLGFSAKEALFKCLNPVVDEFFDFLDVEVSDVSSVMRTMQLRLRRRLASFPEGSVFTAYFEVVALRHAQVWATVTWPDPGFPAY